MNENEFHFGQHYFRAVPVKDDIEARNRCYKCWFYGLFCFEKQNAGVIPSCGALSRKDGKFVFFKVKERNDEKR